MMASAQALLAGLLDIGTSRLALARVEIEEERLRLAGLLIWACVGLFMLGVGLVLLALLLVLLAWNGPREWVLGGLTLAYLLAAAAACWRWRRLSANKPPLLAATLAELKRDQAALMETLR
jgi:uncharacterized membrane protein YqjE